MTSGAERFRERLERVRGLRLLGYDFRNESNAMRTPGEDGYSALEKIAIAKGYGDIVEEIRRNRTTS